MSLIEELLNKGFILNHSPRKPVQKPGSRGGKGYYTDKGKWEYGTKPYPRLPKPDLAYGVNKLRTPSLAPDLAVAINKHLGPYLEKMIEHEEFFNTGVINLRGEFGGANKQAKNAIREAIKQTESGLEPWIKPGFTPKILGSGVEAMAIDLGDKVARIQAKGFNPVRQSKSAVPDRPKYPWMLQAVDKGETKLLGWEILPRVELVNKDMYDAGERVAYDAMVGDTSTDKGIDMTVVNLYYNKINKDIATVTEQAEEDNYEFQDNHPGNIGYLNGKPIIIDPGSVWSVDPDTGRVNWAEAATSKLPLKSKLELENLDKTIESHYIAIQKRGYKVMDKTVMLDLEKRVETWRAVDAVTHNVEQAFPDLKDIMAKQPLVINVTSASLGDGVRGEHHSPLYEGAPNIIDISSEYSRTFMHELGHYLDSAAAILHPSGQWNYKHKLSDMYNTPIFNVVAKLKGLPEYRQWIEERPKKERNYWTRNSEVFGRFFDQYMYHKLGKPPSDSYEPYTDQELEEVGKLLEDGLKQLRLVKAFNFLSTWTKAFGNDNEPDQATIGMEGGKYYVDKYGKKHYGPYGTQPAKHLKVTATEQPYIHEQALSVAPHPIPKAPPPQKTISQVVNYWDSHGPGSYKDLVAHFMKTASKTMLSQALDQGEGYEAIQKYAEAIDKEVVSKVTASSPGATEFKNLILYLMTQKDKLKLNEVSKFNVASDPDKVYDKALGYFNNSNFGGMANQSLNAVDENQLGIIAIAMMNEAERNLGKKIGYDARMALQEKYLKYLQKRKEDITESLAATEKIFKHSVKIEDFPAAPPPTNSPSPDIEAKIRSEFPSYSRQDWKRKVQNDVGNRMIKLGITKEQTNEFLKITGKRPRDSTIDPRLSVADILVETWAQSADGAVPLSVAVQRLTSEVFPGARKWDTINEWNDKYGWDRATTFLQNPVFVQVASAFLYAQYENTQDYFKRFGVSELTIGRGLKTKDQMIVDASNKAEKESKDKEWGDKWVASGEWDESSWFTNPLSSWGFDPSTNSGFSGTSTVDPAGGMPSSDQPGQPVVVAIRVPVQRIIGGFFSGNGAENEHEVVLIGMQKNLDKALWGTWGTNAGGTDISRIGTSVAQALMEGQKPTGHTLNWTTPEEDFTAEFKPLLQAKGAEQGWSKFTDKQLLGEIQMLLDPFTQTGIAVGKNAAVIDNNKVLEIAHKLMDKGFGIPYEEFIDKKLKTMLPLLQDATPEQKETTIPKNLIANFVNDGIIDKKYKDEAIEYLKYKLKTAKPSEQYKEAPDKIKDTTEKFLDEWGITNKNFMYHGNTTLGAVKSISKLVGDTLGTTDAEKQDSAEEVYSYLIVKWGGLFDASH